MQSRVSFFLICLAVAPVLRDAPGTKGQNECPVTKAPEHPFIPPAGYDPYRWNDGRFLLGTAELWVLVTPHWVHRSVGNKLPYFSEEFFYGRTEGDPRLAVVARRLDRTEPLVWSEWVNSAGPSFVSGDPAPRNPKDHGFMVTSLPIPKAGCWEIAARYFPARDKVQTVTYTVSVEQ